MKQKRTAEDYLKTIHILSRCGEVRGTHIADMLGVSRATVSLTLKALEQEGYLLRMADHTVRLTDSGREIAEATYARNRFFRTMLSSLGVDEKTSAHDACELEHAVSPESFAALQRLLPGNEQEGEQTNEA